MEEIKSVANSLFIKLLKIGFIVVMVLIIILIALYVIWDISVFINNLAHHIKNSWDLLFQRKNLF